jgi:hypothetical protein
LAQKDLVDKGFTEDLYGFSVRWANKGGGCSHPRARPLTFFFKTPQFPQQGLDRVTVAINKRLIELDHGQL